MAYMNTWSPGGSASPALGAWNLGAVASQAGEGCWGWTLKVVSTFGFQTEYSAACSTILEASTATDQATMAAMPSRP